MKQSISIILLVLLFISASFSQETSESINISGIVTDFENNTIDSVDIMLMNEKFQPIYKTISNLNGEYQLNVKKGLYLGLFSCKDYKTKNLEYWAWNIPAYQDLKINPQIDGLEVYAVNAFIPQGALPSFIIYFRPMSLKRFKNMSNKKNQAFNTIAPNLSKEDIVITINGESVELLEINKVRESVGKNQYMESYLIQTGLPENFNSSDYVKICITLKDSKTNEKGAACLFWKNKYYYYSREK